MAVSKEKITVYNLAGKSHIPPLKAAVCSCN